VSYLDIAGPLAMKKRSGRLARLTAKSNCSGDSLPSVMAATRQLTGYGGGLWRKAWLLNPWKSVFTSPQMALF
jgi:hypothetical protein